MDKPILQISQQKQQKGEGKKICLGAAEFKGIGDWVKYSQIAPGGVP